MHWMGSLQRVNRGWLSFASLTPMPSDQDKNQAHLNIHASKVNVLILLSIVLRSKGQRTNWPKFILGFINDIYWLVWHIT